MVHCILGFFTFVRQMIGVDIGCIHPGTYLGGGGGGRCVRPSLGGYGPPRDERPATYNVTMRPRIALHGRLGWARSERAILGPSGSF